MIEYCTCETKHVKDTYKSTKGYVCCILCFKKIEGCVNCLNFVKLNKHPWNTKKSLKGKISEHSGLFACVAEHEIKQNREAMVADSETGNCELFVDKSNKK